MVESFSPDRLEKLSGLPLVNKQEKNSIGTSGRYKGKSILIGSAVIEHESLDEVLDSIHIRFDLLKENGITDINLTVNLAYADQCNWEFTPKQLKLISDMNIPLGVTCYKIES